MISYWLIIKKWNIFDGGVEDSDRGSKAVKNKSFIKDIGRLQSMPYESFGCNL